MARVVLLSNGATRIVDPFGLADWAGVVALVSGPGGPGDLIARVRHAEEEHGVAPDDATVACCDLGTV